MVKRNAVVVALLCAALLYAADAHAQPFNVTITPNNFTAHAGTVAAISVVTQSTASTPSTTTSITYNLSLTPDFAGGTPQIPTSTPQISTRTAAAPPNNWTAVTITVNVAANTVPGQYSGPLVGSYEISPGNPTSFTFGNVFLTVTAPAATQDFALTATPPSITLAPGAGQQVLFTATGLNGFNAPITIVAPSVPGLTFTPAQLTLIPGQSVPVTITASVGAAGTAVANFTASANVNSSTVTHTVPVTVIVGAAGNAPTITSVTPPAIVRGAAPVTLRVAGTNFQPGAVVFADSPAIVVQSTRVFSSELADVTAVAQADADLHRTYTLLLRNPSGATTARGVQLLLYDQDAIGAPLAVRAAAVLSPVDGTLVAGTDTVYPRGLVATTGSGILHGQWRLDGIAYETFEVLAQAGMPVEVRGRTKVPAVEWGDHTLTLAVSPRLDDLAPGSAGAAVSPAITIISTVETATKLTVFAPPDRVIIAKDIPRFRWSIVPGASGYLIEIGSRDKPAQRTVRVRETKWTPTRDQLRDFRTLNGGIALWRVRPVFPGDVLGEPTAQRALVILPEAVVLRGLASPAGEIAWSGGSGGLLYRIETFDRNGSLLFTAVAVREQYTIPLFARGRVAGVRITPATVDGHPLGAAAVVPVAAMAVASATEAAPGKIGTSPEAEATVDTTQPLIGATWENAVAENSVSLFLDDTDVTPVSTVTPTSIVYESLLPLAPGPHTARVRAGSGESTWKFSVAPSAGAPPAAGQTTPSVPHRDYTLTPNGMITWTHPGKNSAHAELSGQGDLESARHLGTKFTGDLAYKGTSGPRTIAQESRNWVVNGSAEEGTTSEEATLGYVTPDLTNGTEFLTTGVARIGAAGQLGNPWGTLSYYQPLTTRVTGMVAGSNQNLHIRSFALATPDQKQYQVRAIALEVNDPGQSALAGSRMRTYGLFGTYNVTPQLTLAGELAHGTLRPDCSALSPGAIAAGALCPTQTRSGNAFRFGFSGTSANTASYGLMIRRVDANFVNPANRGLTAGGVADRTSVDFNLGRTFGNTTLGLTAREQLGGRSHDSTSPRSSQTGGTLSASTIFSPHFNVNAMATLSQDRGDASAAFSLPRTDRLLDGVNATFSELFGQGYTVSETLSVQRSADHVNSLANQTSSSVNVMFSGTIDGNVTLSANGGMTRSAGAKTIGTTDQYTLSVQPSIAFPRAFLSLAPRVGYNRSTNGLTQSASSGAQYAAVLQWSPAWWNSLLSGQASASWNGSASSAPFARTHQFGRSYIASIDVRWGGLHAGAATTTPSLLPGAVQQPPSVAQPAAAPAVSH